MIQTREEKELLLKDISARLPYQPLCKKVDAEDNFCEWDVPLGYSLRDLVDNKIIIKPYLRPMSSMTEEEEKEFNDQMYKAKQYSDDKSYNVYEVTSLNIDWLNAHHFDYRGLIPMGLALSALEGMYKKE